MKKLLYILGGIIVLIIIIAIVGGGGGEKKETTPSTEKVPTVYSINQNVKVGNAMWTLLAAEDKGSILKGSESKYPDWYEDKITTGKFIRITLEVENTGTITESWWTEPTLIDEKNREFKPASEVYAWIPEEKQPTLKELHPGITQQFIWIYEVPTDAAGLKVKVKDIATPSKGEALINLSL